MASKLGRVFLTCSFLAIAIASFVIAGYQVPGFVPSLYHGVPVVIWGLLAFAFVTGMAIALVASSYRAFGVLASTLSLGVFYLIPYVRTGLPNGRGDTISHMGYVGELARSGTFDPNALVYPLTHLHTLAIVQTANLDLNLVFGLYLPIVVSVYVLFSYLLSRRIVADERYRVLVVLISLLPMFNSYSNQVAPNAVGLYLTMVLLYLYVNMATDPTWRNVALVFPIAGATIVAHPLLGFMLFQVFVGTMILWYYYPVERSSVELLRGDNTILLVVLVLITILYVGWYVLTTTIWANYVVSLIEVIQGIEQSKIAKPIERTQGLPGLVLLKSFVVIYGGQVIISILTVGGLVGVLHRATKERRWRTNVILLVPLILWMIINSIYIVAGLLLPAVLFSSLRIVPMVYIATPIFASYPLFVLFDSIDVNWKRAVSMSLITLVLFGAFAVSFYDSGLTNRGSDQQTKHEYAGTNWVIDNKNREFAVLGFGRYRYEERILGRTAVQDARRSEFPSNSERLGTLPHHLVTDDGAFIVDALDNPRYIYLAEPNFVRGYRPRISPSDERRLHARTNKVYSNGEYRVYFSS